MEQGGLSDLLDAITARVVGIKLKPVGLGATKTLTLHQASSTNTPYDLVGPGWTSGANNTTLV